MKTGDSASPRTPASSRAAAAKPTSKKATTQTPSTKTASTKAAATKPAAGRQRDGSGTGRKKTDRTRTRAQAGAPTGNDASDSTTGTEPGTDSRQIPEFPDLVDVGEFIRQQREKMEMSVRRLSELAGVSNPYLSQIERGLRNPSADILQQVANALRISVETLYVRAGILPDQDRSVSTVPEAIEHDHELTPDQKVALLNVYQSFVSSR